MSATAADRLPRVVGAALGGAVALACELVSPVLGVPVTLAVPLCDAPPRVRVLRSGLGVLESAIVDPLGRLFFTSQTYDGLKGAVLRMDHPDAKPVKLAGGITSPGGLAFDERGMLIVGFGDSPQGGVIGNVVGLAGLLVIDPDSGERETWVTGLGMANGIARAADGTIFASNDFGTHIDRVDPHGNVQRRWARVPSANGLAIDPSGRYLYAAQTFVAAAIKRVEIANPANVTTHAQPRPLARAAALDGLTVDDAGRLYVAANGAGQIWRIEPDGNIHALARGLKCPSAVAIGHGANGFRERNLYAVTFHGDIIELTGGAHEPHARRGLETSTRDRTKHTVTPHATPKRSGTQIDAEQLQSQASISDPDQQPGAITRATRPSGARTRGLEKHRRARARLAKTEGSR
jgi:sugar lactone lactonase YvrE